MMTMFVQLLHATRRSASALATGLVQALQDLLSAPPFPTLIRGALLTVAIGVAANLAATPGRATSSDAPCIEMGESWNEDGEYYCIVCEIQVIDECVVMCTNGIFRPLECPEGWF